MTERTALTTASPASPDEVAVKPVDNYIFWFNNRPTVEGGQAIGPHFPAGDPLVDELADQLKWQSYTVIHQDLAEKPYWKPSSVSLIFLAQNTQSPQELRQAPRKGMVHAWGPVLDRKTGEWQRNKKGETAIACHIKVRVFIHELVRLGYYEPFLLSLKGRITDSMMATAQATYRLTRALTFYRRRRDNTDPVYLYSVSGPVKAATKPVPAGEESFIYPILSALPPRLDDEFIEQHETPMELVELIRQEGLLQRALEWSTQESFQIKKGLNPDQFLSSPVVVREIPPAPTEPISEASQDVESQADEEDEAFEALFGEAPNEQVARLEALKEQFQKLYRKFSQQEGWWEMILYRVFPNKWPEGTTISETDLSSKEIEHLEKVYQDTRKQLAAKRAAKQAPSS